MLRPLALAAFGLFAGAASASDSPGRKEFAADLEPGKVHEECLRLEAGERRRYRWKSSAPVDFNIHFHRGNEVSYPVKKDGLRSWRDGFPARSSEDYCWMWTARTKPARIEGWIGK